MTKDYAISEIESFNRRQMGSYLYRFEFMEDALIRAFENLSRYVFRYSLQDFSGDYFIGEEKNGQRNGFGAYVWKDSSIDSLYIGEWRNGNREGEGIILRKNSCYKGGFLDGQYHGRGQFVFSSGLVFEAVFDRGDISRLLRSNYDFSFNGRDYSAR